MLTREAAHTVRIVQFLATPEVLREGTTAMDIHAALGIPGILLRGILRRLTVAGIVHSKRGRTGGVNLEEKALKLSVLDVLNAVNAKKARNPNPWDPNCGKANDAVCALFCKAYAKTQEVLANTTVAQLVEG